MKFQIVTFLLINFLICFGSFNAFSQGGSRYTIRLKNGIYNPEKGIRLTKSLTKGIGNDSSQINYYLMQYYHLPEVDEKKKLESLGIELLGYIPDNSYVASIPSSVASKNLKGLGLRSVELIKPVFKIDSTIIHNTIPSHAIKSGKVELQIIYFRNASIEQLKSSLKNLSIEILKENSNNRFVEIRTDTSKVSDISLLNEVSYITPVAPLPEPFAFSAITDIRTNILQSGILDGRNLTGNSITIGINDDGYIMHHADLQNRVQNLNPPSFKTHNLAVAGVAAGAGNINSREKGMAPNANLITDFFPILINNAYIHYNNSGMTITNNSFGYGGYFGAYDVTSIMCDEQLNDSLLLGLIHVLAASNAGDQGFNTVSSGWTSSKNVLTVGATNERDVPSGYSGKGPVRDGRIKPEIVAVGDVVASLAPRNGYAPFAGTSAACPGVSGTLALLYERYKNLGFGSIPDAELIKAIVCNTADDLANPGPDFSTGFGRLNARKAVEVLEGSQYFKNSLSNGQSFTHTIEVPSGTNQLKVLLYWDDKPGTVFSAVNLVNNLDLSVMQGAQTFLPWILNPSQPSLNAVRGVDNINNIEQVTIDNPVAGTYSLKVNASNVPFGPENYVLVYEIIQPGITVTYPYGGESLVPGDKTLIRWDATGNNNLTVQYALNDGSGFIDIATNVPATQNWVEWEVPNVKGKGIVRVTDDKYNGESISEFSILKIPSGLIADTTNPTSFKLSWQPVEDDATYEAFLLSPSDKIIQSKGTTVDTSFQFNNLIAGAEYWMSVRAIAKTGEISERAYAITNKFIPPPPKCENSGFITRELWGNVPGVKVSDIPNRPPDCSTLIDKFEVPYNFADNYATRIRGFICTEAEGSYIFWISGNDNCELWLSTDDNPENKRKIAFVPGFTSVREWKKYPVQQSVPIRLEANKTYYVEALHKEGSNNDNLAVGWQTPNGVNERPIPGHYLSPFIEQAKPLPVNGLVGTYYDELNFSGISTVRVDSIINFNFGSGSPSICIQPDKFSVRWVGQVMPEFNEEYTFFTTSNDGVRLFINNEKIIDNFTDHAAIENKGNIILNAGQLYPVTLEYYEGVGTAQISLSWSSKSQAKQIIPHNKLFTSSVALNPAGMSIDETKSDNDFILFPNPTDNQLNLLIDTIANERIKLEIIDPLTGQIQLSFDIKPSEKKLYSFDVSKLTNGIYQVRLITDKEIKVKKIQIMR